MGSPYTKLPKTNIVPENGWLEDEFSYWEGPFSVDMLVSGRVDGPKEMGLPAIISPLSIWSDYFRPHTGFLGPAFWQGPINPLKFSEKSSLVKYWKNLTKKFFRWFKGPVTFFWSPILVGVHLWVRVTWSQKPSPRQGHEVTQNCQVELFPPTKSGIPCVVTWRMGSQGIVSSERITPMYVSHEGQGHLEGVPQPYFGDLRTPWLLTTY